MRAIGRSVGLPLMQWTNGIQLGLGGLIVLGGLAIVWARLF